jgi:NADH dehydrogenase
VVVGAGFGGLAVARGLRHVEVDVTVIDRTNHHLFQPLLYQVSTALLAPGDIATPLRQALSDNPRARVVLGEVTSVDPGRRTVEFTTADAATSHLTYDYLVIAAGAETNYFGNDHWASNASGMKTLDDAVGLRSQILRAFETAATTHDAAAKKAWMTFVIVGAGPTGVELAGQIAALSRRTLAEQFRELDPTGARIVLADAGESVLSPFHTSLQEHAHRRLNQLGIEVRLGEQASDIDDQGIVLRRPDKGGAQDTQSADSICARTVIWAAGVRPVPLTGVVAAATDVDLDGKGRLRVRRDCTLPGHPDIFAIGDMVDLDDLPGLAEPAMQEGRFVARVITSRVNGGPVPGAFRYTDLGTMATISPFDAVAQRGRIRLAGLPAKVAWCGVHVAFLVGWGNRVAVLASWAWALATRRRQQRIILESVEGRGQAT